MGRNGINCKRLRRFFRVPTCHHPNAEALRLQGTLASWCPPQRRGVEPICLMHKLRVLQIMDYHGE